MNSILMYQDYRRFLRDYYDLKKRTSAFSWRDYSRMSGFVSPVFMQRVCEGKANLGKKATVKVADAFKFVGMERDYFFNMVTYAQAKTDDAKLLIFISVGKVSVFHSSLLRYKFTLPI